MSASIHTGQVKQDLKEHQVNYITVQRCAVQCSYNLDKLFSQKTL